MIKQRRDSVEQYQKANRQTLADQELYEIDLLQKYLPPPLSEEAVTRAIEETINKLNASSIKDMGAVMKALQSELQARADMSIVSTQVRKRLS